jgi:hypothetical protein
MKKVTGQFRNTTWDPLLIVSQIVALQCVMYVGLGLWTVFMDLLVGSSRSLDHLFKYQVIFTEYLIFAGIIARLPLPNKLILVVSVLKSRGLCILVQSSRDRVFRLRK